MYSEYHKGLRHVQYIALGELEKMHLRDAHLLEKYYHGHRVGFASLRMIYLL